MIENRISSQPCVNNTDEVRKLEKMLDLVRAPQPPLQWETLVEQTFKAVVESSFTELFCNLTEQMKPENGESKVYRLLALYALFVDVIACCAQNNLHLSTETELQKLHVNISLHLGDEVLVEILGILHLV